MAVDPTQFLPIGPCRSCLKHSYFDHDTKEYRISGTCGNGPGNDPFDRGSDHRCIGRCARFDSCDEAVDILYIRLRWTECCGFPVRLSQSAVLKVAETSMPIQKWIRVCFSTGAENSSAKRLPFQGIRRSSAIVPTKISVNPRSNSISSYWSIPISETGFIHEMTDPRPACAPSAIMLMPISCVCQLNAYAMMLKNPKRAGPSTPLPADNGNHWGCIVEMGHS